MSTTTTTATPARHGRVEQGVQQRVNGTVDQRQGLGEHVHHLGHLRPVLGPNMDQVDAEIRSPAGDEGQNDAQRHLHRTHARPRHRRHVESSRTAQARRRRSTSGFNGGGDLVGRVAIHGRRPKEKTTTTTTKMFVRRTSVLGCGGGELVHFRRLRRQIGSCPGCNSTETTKTTIPGYIRLRPTRQIGSRTALNFDLRGLRAVAVLLTGFGGAQSRGPSRVQLPAASPDDEDNVDVTECHQHGRDNEDVCRQRGKIELALPPGRVPATRAFVLNHAFRVNSNRYLHAQQTPIGDF